MMMILICCQFLLPGFLIRAVVGCHQLGLPVEPVRVNGHTYSLVGFPNVVYGRLHVKKKGVIGW